MNLGEPDFRSLEFSMADQMFLGSSQGAEIEEDMEGGEIADVSHHGRRCIFFRAGVLFCIGNAKFWQFFF